MGLPTVSVVMGVYNGGEALLATLDSVLSQEGVDLEFIVVDDGSTDDTADRLARRAASDRRLRVLTQPRNQGLTEALIRGCAEARGEFIARQDCGDRSLPGRLRRQAEWLANHPGAAMVSCHTRTVGLFGETIYESRISSSILTDSLLRGGPDGYAGPSHHGSVMMRADAYRRAGGYRQPFVVAQDLDLWLRLVEVGSVGVLDFVGYEAAASPSGISAQRLGLQRRLAELAAKLAEARRCGRDEAPILAAFDSAIPTSNGKGWKVVSDYRHAAYLYFLGRCVRHQEPELARRYFRAGIARCPWHLRSWYGLAVSLIKGSR
jgi:glycosyltransferase involved in cell wall biosynthesis